MSSTGGGVYRSSDSGDTWEHVSMAGHGVSSFALDIDGSLLAGTQLNYFGVYRSEDNGIIWQKILSGHVVTSLAVDEFGGIYAGCDSDFGPEGVKYSYNNGLSWEALNAGLHDDAYITSLAISPANYIFAATYSPNKLYKSVNPIVSISEKSREQLDIKVFPNPFNEKLFVQINNMDNRGNDIYIQFYNVSGIKITEIKIYNSITVSNQIKIDTDFIKPGMYLMKIIIGQENYSIKILKK